MSLAKYILAAVILLFSWEFGLLAETAPQKKGVVFPMVEISFRPEGQISEPYSREYWGWIEGSAGNGFWLPAFYDGQDRWKLRFSPRAMGTYHVKICVRDEGTRTPVKVADLQPDPFVVGSGESGHGLIRTSSQNPRTFVYEDGESYFPVGLNIGWDLGRQGDVVAFLERLAAAGGNWSRIWMCHWDDKNLNWPQGRKLPPGELDPAAAAKWDRIVAAADRLRVPFQMVLQHHGQFSSSVDAAWKDNPWNKANGGFLDRAEDFFTDPLARKLTRQKYRYIVARYGYSPSIMAWELFNEVEFTDAAKTAEGRTAIREWHEEMAGYLRSIDPCHHLITTSAVGLKEPLWNVLDYYQQHSYPPDPLAGSAGFAISPLALAKPIFYGEIGSAGDGGRTNGDGGRTLRDILWGGIFSGAGASAQYWAWDQTDREELYPLIRSLARFSKEAKLGQGFWHSVQASVSTPGYTGLVFGPGQRWESVVDPELKLAADGSGRPFGVGFSATLRPRRGSGERLGTDFLTLLTDVVRPGRLEITVNEVSSGGAKLDIEVDGKNVLSRDWAPVDKAAAARELPVVLGMDLPMGARTVRIRSAGPDYFQISSIKLGNYAPELGVRAMSNDQNTVLWIYRLAALDLSPFKASEGGTAAGKVQLSGLADGSYHVRWWDTVRGEWLREEECSVREGRLVLDTVPVHSDVAVLLERKAP